MNIIDERDVRTVYRKLRKKEYDDLMTLSVGRSEEVVLLDEGMVVDAYGSPLFYIMKGTLEKYLDKLPDDYEGSINLGHMDFATFPFLIGHWTKKDFSLVDIGDGRKRLMVRLNLDEESFIVKELRRADYSLGVSAEFGYHVNEQFTNEYGIEILDEIFISNFAIVGECGNVNSSGIRLKGEKMAVDVKSLAEAMETSPDLTEINKKLEALLEEPAAEEEPKEEETQEAAEEPQEEPEAEEEPVEEVEEAEEMASEADLAAILNTIEELQAQVRELQETNDSLTQKLTAQRKAEMDFVAKFKQLSVSLAAEKKAETKEEIVYTDGIGE